VLPDLKVEVPQLEPPPVLLAQLAQLAQQHPPATTGPGSTRALMAAATVTVVGGLSWLTGTLPGVASPFTGSHTDRPAHHAPVDPSPGAPSGGHAAVPATTPPTAPPTAPPGQTKPHLDNGNHTGQTTPHANSGNHTGQTKPHANSGNHTGQTTPHTNSGNHTGQTTPHTDSGNHTGQVKPHLHSGQRQAHGRDGRT
jgi:hypothetical protein